MALILACPEDWYGVSHKRSPVRFGTNEGSVGMTFHLISTTIGDNFKTV